MHVGAGAIGLNWVGFLAAKLDFLVGAQAKGMAAKRRRKEFWRSWCAKVFKGARVIGVLV